MTLGLNPKVVQYPKGQRGKFSPGPRDCITKKRQGNREIMKKISQSKNEILSVCFKIINAYYPEDESSEGNETPELNLELYCEDPLLRLTFELINEDSNESMYKQLNRALGFSELFEPYNPEDYIKKQFCAVVEISKEHSTIEILGIYDVDYSKEDKNA